ncbi:NAD-dependent epimerase/dehydratase family protein [Salipiger sp. IMCC34102]|uniref:NAD(P)-dependent oxidoreductase n=1 Tax=Salipiger sp. IMCC34102 TaxID=2510647 RepID=UPI00101BC297|nr:NAD(P)H-binding protein [Salipiger sp. IMCC34102]RYH02360.1 NAD-dependent epimerase/dehydratase family protein [Salipiger sp. IMCC34102]
MKLAVFGAKGAVGRKLIDQALAKGHEIVALEPTWDDAEPPAGVTPQTCDVLKDDIGPHLEGCDAVLSCLGVGNAVGTLLDPPPLYTRGTSNILAGMHKAGVSRVVVISATFVAARDRGPLHFRVPAMAALHNVIEQMAEMEALLRASDTEWTAVRPGWMMDGPPTDDYVVTPDVIPQDLIRARMADVAQLMLACVEEGIWIRQTPALARAEDPDTTSIEAVAKEFLG